MKINLIMFNPNKYGGTVSYTAHLYLALKQAGHDPMIYRLGKGPASKPKDFGYGCLVRTASVEAMLREPGRMLVTACIGKEFEEPTLRLFNNGARLVIHDPNDLGNFVNKEFVNSTRIVIIRANNTSICPNATFIPHPFVRSLQGFRFNLPRERHAVTLSRLGAIKRTKWILEANRLLPPERQVWLRGYDDRFFTYNAFVRDSKYPEFKQDAELPEDQKKTFPKELGAAQAIASTARFLVDLTEIKGDGGGSQYAFLEGMDAGCVLVLNKAWVKPGGIWEAGVNCLTVGSAQELADVLAFNYPMWELKQLAANAYDMLQWHDPVEIANQYVSFLEATE